MPENVQYAVITNVPAIMSKRKDSPLASQIDWWGDCIKYVFFYWVPSVVTRKGKLDFFSIEYASDEEKNVEKDCTNRKFRISQNSPENVRG